MSDKVCVLVVEDEALVRLAIVDTLQESGFEVLECESAVDALSVFHGGTAIDLLFTDVNLAPGMDGIVLASTVHRSWPRVAIIVTSGHSQAKASELPTGTRFFCKPYQHQEIISAIRELAIH
jgi:CheY-like chemotaxis protein